MSETGTLADAIQVAFDPDAPAGDPGYGGFTGAEPPRALQDKAAAQAAAANQPTADPAIVAAIEAARREEKDKLYPRLTESEKKLQEMQETMAQLTKEREDAIELQRQQQEADAEAAKKAREEEMSARELVEQVRAEMEQKVASERDERLRLQAILEREQQVAQWDTLRQERLSGEDVRNEIAPQMMRFVNGNDPETLEQSIAAAKQATAEMLAELQQQQVAQWHAQPGVSARGPVGGPMEQQDAYRAYTPQDIAAMPMSEYMKNRPALLKAASDARLRQS